MAIISANRSTTLRLTLNNEKLIILPGVTLTAATGVAMDATALNLSIVNYGNVLSTGYGLFSYNYASIRSIVNGTSGIIHGDTAGLYVATTNTYISNAGTISNSGNAVGAIYLAGSGQLVHNLASGSLQAGSSGIYSLATDNRAFNSGTIAGGRYGVSVDADNFFLSNSGMVSGARYAGVRFDDGASTLLNRGTVEGGDAGISIGAQSRGGTIRNMGFIDGEIGILVATSSTAAAVQIVNRGTIQGEQAILASGSGAVDVRNVEAIFGDVIAGAGADSIRNSGIIEGAVRLGGGNDSFNGSGGSVSEVVQGDAGNDMLIAGDGDWVHGGLGNDTLRGAGDADRIEGGRGADMMFGGAGMDSFLYVSVLDTTVEPAGRDRIAGFERGDDLIDFSRIDADTTAAGNQAFSFVGTSAFTGDAGELRVANSGPTLWISGDVDGNGTADFIIVLTGAGGTAAQFTAGDFIL